MRSEFDKGWLVGFTEGEGSFLLFEGRPVFQIAQKNREILEEILQKLRVGHIHLSTRCFKYRVTDVRSSQKIFQIFNGLLKTEKKKVQFERWLKFFKSKSDSSSMTTRDFDDGWVVGFTEAEGSFYYRRQDGYPSFRIVQNEREILEWVRAYFGFGRVQAHYKSQNSWEYVISRKDLLKIRNFFDGRLKHPDVIERFNFWKSLFDYNHPLRVAGREKEKNRARAVYPKRKQYLINYSRNHKRGRRIESS